jgi:hypothetical protein
MTNNATNRELDPKLVENQQQKEEVKVTIQINVNELNVIFAALQELPHRVADPILKKVFEQAQKQLN